MSPELHDPNEGISSAKSNKEGEDGTKANPIMDNEPASVVTLKNTVPSQEGAASQVKGALKRESVPGQRSPAGPTDAEKAESKATRIPQIDSAPTENRFNVEPSDNLEATISDAAQLPNNSWVFWIESDSGANVSPETVIKTMGWIPRAGDRVRFERQPNGSAAVDKLAAILVEEAAETQALRINSEKKAADREEAETERLKELAEKGIDVGPMKVAAKRGRKPKAK